MTTIIKYTLWVNKKTLAFYYNKWRMIFTLLSLADFYTICKVRNADNSNTIKYRLWQESPWSLRDKLGLLHQCHQVTTTQVLWYDTVKAGSPAGWLPVHRDQLRAQRSVSSMGKPLPLPLQCWDGLRSDTFKRQLKSHLFQSAFAA